MFHFHVVERKLAEITGILPSWRRWDATSSGDKSILGEHFSYDKFVFSNLICSPNVQTRSTSAKSFAYSVTGWRWIWQNEWNSEMWRSGSETWHLIVLRYSVFQLSIQDTVGCQTYQKREGVLHPSSSWNSTRYLHFGSWVHLLIPCFHVHKPTLCPSPTCAEWGMWGERKMWHLQWRRENNVLHFIYFQSICFNGLYADVQISLLIEGTAISHNCHGTSVVLHSQHWQNK